MIFVFWNFFNLFKKQKKIKLTFTISTFYLAYDNKEFEMKEKKQY